MDASDCQDSLWTELPDGADVVRRPGGGRRSGPVPAPPELLAAIRNPTGVLFLDVETTGLSLHYDRLTMVGYETGGRRAFHIAGDDPRELLEALAAAEVLVTFNGKLFDVPFLLATFGPFKMPRHHLDLRFAVRRVGLSGGQKAIEASLGLSLRDGFEGDDGAAAVLLWHRYLRGDLEALRRLLVYNEADVRGMKAILDYVVATLGLGRDLLGEAPVFLDLAEPTSAASTRTLPNPGRLPRRPATFGSLFSRAAGATVVGIDLTGSEAKPSGFAVLSGCDVLTSMVATDDELVAATVAASPSLVSIDSPLSLPNGRTTPWDDDPMRHVHGIMRTSERTLKRRGINVYPCLLPSMQKLTARGMGLARRLRDLGIPVIESYPGAAQDIMGIPRKGAGKEWLALGLAEFGLRGPFATGGATHDELDAATAALVGTFFLEGLYEALDGPGENALIVPKLDMAPRVLAVALSGPISAGKTTAARALERRGFRYVRFSMVLDDELRARGVAADRASRQAIGMEIHASKGQGWLCERVLERLAGAECAVIDGLRWPEDRGFLLERFGSGLLHVHVEAAAEIRADRYRREPGQGRPFAEAESQPVEGSVADLGRLADVAIPNEASLGEFEDRVVRAVAAHADKIGVPCPFPS
ncbi:ribonuclease H-like domain-containing protein [Methylobacterium mesophilicum]|uniref:ribonuclease H-like domain-containing protein n=1 Tax=Methylobacterium mesophilicum TaxID=39956 RepID=UPI002F33DBAF